MDTPLALTASPPEAAVEEVDVSVDDDPDVSVEDDPVSVEDDPESVEDDPESDVSVDKDESAVVVVVEEESEELDDPLFDEEPLFTLLILIEHVWTSWTA